MLRRLLAPRSPLLAETLAAQADVEARKYLLLPLGRFGVQVALALTKISTCALLLLLPIPLIWGLAELAARLVGEEELYAPLLVVNVIVSAAIGVPLAHRIGLLVKLAILRHASRRIDASLKVRGGVSHGSSFAAGAHFASAGREPTR